MTTDPTDTRTVSEKRAMTLWVNIDVHLRLGQTVLAINVCGVCGQPCPVSADRANYIYVCGYCGHASNEPAAYGEYKFTVECSHCGYDADGATFYYYESAVKAANHHSNIRECNYSTRIKDIS